MRRTCALVISAIGLLLPTWVAAQSMASGYVFLDSNKNGVKDRGEMGIAGVRVSNQRTFAKTDSNGKWTMPYTGDEVFFVVKPSGYAPPVNKENLPLFYYISDVEGSPSGLRFKGIDPTGAKPSSIDFPLYKQDEPDRFKAIMFADTQPRDVREAEYIAHDVVESLIGVDASFGVTLGDVVFDNLSVYGPLNGAIGLIGIPWYNVVGNHDLNLDVKGEADSIETFKRIFGPNYYSFDYGPTHFIVLDDVEYLGQGNGYRGGIGKQQMEWVKNDLAGVPEDQLVVLLMHIPLVNVGDRAELYRLIEKRPYTMSVSGHTHYQQHYFLDKGDGWMGLKPHHHLVAVTVSGSWWQGAPNERGIPHATMRDGAPNGYSVFTFDGHNYSFEFRAAGAPAAYQMNIYAPEELTVLEAIETSVMVNVFGGSERSKVEVRMDDGSWTPMMKVSKPDPDYAATVEREKGLQRPYRPLPGAMNSSHLWEVSIGALFGNVPPANGTHQLEVRTTDMFGQTYVSQRIIRIS